VHYGEQRSDWEVNRSGNEEFIRIEELVCASGLKSVMLGTAGIALGERDVVLTGGFESMSRVPFYAVDQRYGKKLGNAQLVDGLIHDGLWDVYNQFHMGAAADLCATTYKISRKEQDAYARSR